MKKLYALLPLLAALLVPGTLSAQMMPDSTVQVVAYWEVGDQMEYIYTEHKYEIDADGNEKLTASSSENIRFEVTAATDSSYTLLVHYDNLFDSELLDVPDGTFPDIPFRIRTSEFGTFEELENLDEIVASIQKVIPRFAKMAWDELPPEHKKEISRKDLEKVMAGLYSEDTIFKSCLEELAPLFFYHGARLDTTEVYSFYEDVSGLFGGDSIPVPSSFWVDPKLTDDYSVVLHKETVADDEQASALVRAYLIAVGKTVAGVMDGATVELETNADESIRKDEMTATYHDYIDEEIHLETGWPIHWMFDRVFLVNTKDGSSGAHIVREITIAPDETEEEAAAEE